MCLTCTPPPPPETPTPSGECSTCDVRFIFEDKVDIVTLEHTTLVLDGKVVFVATRWSRDADVGPMHVSSGKHVARALLVYRKDNEAYDVRSEHEFTASEGLILHIEAVQGGSPIAPIAERVAIAWRESH